MTQRTTVPVLDTSTPPGRRSAPRRERIGELPQVMIVLSSLAVVVALDQAFKWWAWRHAPTAVINRGGNPFVPATIDGWYADPLIGALLDLLDVGLLSCAAFLLLHRRRSSLVLLTGAVMLGGWASNLLDRLGMHYWTAPGSIRGAVDFIHLQLIIFNVADVFIALGTPLFVLAVSASYLGGWTRRGPPATSSITRSARRRTWIRTVALTAGVGVVAVVGIGATNYGGVTAPTTSTRTSAQSIDAGAGSPS
jgi:lipoprotein signal peptidase